MINVPLYLKKWGCDKCYTLFEELIRWYMLHFTREKVINVPEDLKKCWNDKRSLLMWRGDKCFIFLRRSVEGWNVSKEIFHDYLKKWRRGINAPYLLEEIKEDIYDYVSLKKWWGMKCSIFNGRDVRMKSLQIYIPWLLEVVKWGEKFYFYWKK